MFKFLVRKMECEDKGRNLSKLMEVDVTEQTLGQYFRFVNFSQIFVAASVPTFQAMRITHLQSMA